jgi:hypothetical protein
MSTETIALDHSTDAEKKSAARAKAATNSPSIAGPLWLGGWLFTVGFCHLVWWKALLALVIWPYFLGASFG